jgi:hypothetical protein
MGESQTKMRVQAALKDRNARVASLFVKNVSNAMDLITEQCPAVLEALIGYIDDLQQHPAPPRRQRVRAAIREYVEDVLREEREREDQLQRGITGDGA